MSDNSSRGAGWPAESIASLSMGSAGSAKCRCSPRAEPELGDRRCVWARIRKSWCCSSSEERRAVSGADRPVRGRGCFSDWHSVQCHFPGPSERQRRKEIAIRTAHGATSAQLLRLLLSEGTALVGARTVLGFLGSIGLAKALSAPASYVCR